MDEQIELLCHYCRLVYERHLVTGTGGNISLRDEANILCSPSGSSLRTVRPHCVSVLNRQGRLTQGKAPTKELGMHLAILNIRSDIDSVFHLHGPHIIAASTLLRAGPDTLPPLTPEFVLHAYPLPMLPFMAPGSHELRDAAAEGFANAGTWALLLQNHGIITAGKDMETALTIAEAVDEAARIYVLTRGKASHIPRDRIAEIKVLSK